MTGAGVTLPGRNSLSGSDGTLTLESRTPEETFSIGRIIGQNLSPGDIVALIGELGAGKTCLTQGIARGLDVAREYRITSPSFTLINEYEGRLMMYHFDLYRLARAAELYDMGCEEYLLGKGVSVIEWADKAEDILPERTIFIRIGYVGESERLITVSGESNRVAVIGQKLEDGGF